MFSICVQFTISIHFLVESVTQENAPNQLFIIIFFSKQYYHTYKSYIRNYKELDVVEQKYSETITPSI